MKLSIIVVTKNRAHALVNCLDSIAVSVNCASADAELIVVDNGATDDTFERSSGWASSANLPTHVILEQRPGKTPGLNKALHAAHGGLLFFTDDDCHLHVGYVQDLLRHSVSDRCEVLRGGRVELGDPEDCPYTINTDPLLQQRSLLSAPHIQNTWRGKSTAATW